MKEDKTYKPPYVSVFTLQKLFDLLSKRNFSEINVNDLESRGFSNSVSFQLIQGLKFLGILDVEGKTTEKAKILIMQGSGKKEQLVNIVKSAYSKLFNTIPNAETLQKQELHDEFMAVYNLSGRLAESAAPVFLWLCSYAGLKVSEIVVVRERSIIRKEISKLNKIQSKEAGSKIKPQFNQSLYPDNSYIDLNIADTGFRLLIPKKPEYEDAVAAGELIEVRKLIIDFAQKNKKVEDSVGLAATEVVDK